MQRKRVNNKRIDAVKTHFKVTFLDKQLGTKKKKKKDALPIFCDLVVSQMLVNRNGSAKVP